MKNNPKIAPNSFESLYWSTNQSIAGLDEVGRGCLAGPVVAAAVILPQKAHYPLLKDSKILTVNERNEAYTWITTHCTYAIGIHDHRTIDRYNIYHCTQKAMLRALSTVLTIAKTPPAAIVLDAMPLPIKNTGLSPETVVFHAPKGESWSTSIAAASIIAKVWRDLLMQKMEYVFPGYQFAAHKGYATPDHYKAMVNYGETIIHRQTFLKKFHADQKGDYAIQQTIC